MKTFIVVSNYDNGLVELKVYRIKKNEPYFIYSSTHHTQSWMGALGEANKGLIELKEIPQSWSVDYRGNYSDYYYKNDKYRIIVIGL